MNFSAISLASFVVFLTCFAHKRVKQSSSLLSDSRGAHHELGVNNDGFIEVTLSHTVGFMVAIFIGTRGFNPFILTG